MTLRVYIGHDPAEKMAFAVAEASLRRRATIPVDVIPLRADKLHAAGLLRRPIDARGGLYDLHSQAPMATEFAISRFTVPLLAHSGWALFVDCDVVFFGDVAELLTLADPTKAVQVVKHCHTPTRDTKMVDKTQTVYRFKSWSSVALFNCDHHGHERLSLDMLNHRPGRDLHAFCWLADSEIGELPPAWNWLVGEQPKPDPLRLAHFTNGGPWLPEWAASEHDSLWIDEAVR